MGTALIIVVSIADSVTVVIMPSEVWVKTGKDCRGVELSVVRVKNGKEGVETVGTTVMGDVIDRLEKLPLLVSEVGWLEVPVGHVQREEVGPSVVSIGIVPNHNEDASDDTDQGPECVVLKDTVDEDRAERVPGVVAPLELD